MYSTNVSHEHSIHYSRYHERAQRREAQALQRVVTPCVVANASADADTATATPLENWQAMR